MIVDSWQGAADPSYVLKRLYILEDAAYPLDYVKSVLKMGGPTDDRVWLGQANAAIWQGRFDEARKWLTPAESAGRLIRRSGSPS